MASWWWQCFVVMVTITLLDAIPVTLPDPPTSTRSNVTDTLFVVAQQQQFALLVSNHFVFDHIDTTAYQLSKHIAKMLCASMTLQRSFQSDSQFTGQAPLLRSNERVNNMDYTQNDHSKTHFDGDVMIPIDIDVLIDQLQDAIESFLEDKLPGAWQLHMQHHQLTRDNLQQLIQQKVQCADRVCLSQQAAMLATSLDEYVQDRLRRAWISLIDTDLISLFDALQRQVEGVLAWMDPQQHHGQLLWMLSWSDMTALLHLHPVPPSTCHHQYIHQFTQLSYQL